jgi:hypothetical protein
MSRREFPFLPPPSGPTPPTPVERVRASLELIEKTATANYASEAELSNALNTCAELARDAARVLGGGK